MGATVTTDILVGLVLALTLTGILVRPWGRSEAWPAVAGATALAASGVIGLADVREALGETADVLLFLLGMMVLSWVADEAGVFAWLAEGCARLARGSGLALFGAVVALAAVVTTVLSLDTTVIMLTPLVWRLATRRGIDPLPMLFAVVLIANTGSLLLPLANLTNLLLYDALGLGFGGFTALLWAPGLAAIVATGAALGWVVRRRIPRRLPPGEVTMPVADGWLRFVAAGVGLTFAGLLGAGLAGWPLAVPALAGSLALVVIGRGRRRLPLAGVRRAVSWGVFAFVVAMTLLVAGVERTLLDGVTVAIPGDPGAALWGSAALATIGSNLINNLPMAILAIPFLPAAGSPSAGAVAVGTLVGTNVGSALTTYGSLATILWLDIVRARGLSITTRDYLAVALRVVPVVLIATLLVAWLVVG